MYNDYNDSANVGAASAIAHYALAATGLASPPLTPPITLLTLPTTPTKKRFAPPTTPQNLHRWSSIYKDVFPVTSPADLSPAQEQSHDYEPYSPPPSPTLQFNENLVRTSRRRAQAHREPSNALTAFLKEEDKKESCRRFCPIIPALRSLVDRKVGERKERA
ncbi:hypothetical protein BOTBODRAFT_181890, partial [Botryobasidium botryosum FD-172 SS1]